MIPIRRHFIEGGCPEAHGPNADAYERYLALAGGDPGDDYEVFEDIKGEVTAVNMDAETQEGNGEA